MGRKLIGTTQPYTSGSRYLRSGRGIAQKRPWYPEAAMVHSGKSNGTLYDWHKHYRECEPNGAGR